MNTNRPIRRPTMADQCDQEMCPMWDGSTCPCETFGLDRDDLPADGVFTVTQPTDQEGQP